MISNAEQINEVAIIFLVTCWIVYPFLVLFSKMVGGGWDVCDDPESFVGSWVFAPFVVPMLMVILLMLLVQGFGHFVFYVIERIANNERNN